MTRTLARFLGGGILNVLRILLIILNIWYKVFYANERSYFKIFFLLFLYLLVDWHSIFSLSLLTTALIIDNAAGFTREWATTSADRVERRQLEVQANSTGNQSTPAEYRTVTSSAQPTQDEEERKLNILYACGLRFWKCVTFCDLHFSRRRQIGSWRFHILLCARGKGIQLRRLEHNVGLLCGHSNCKCSLFTDNATFFYFWKSSNRDCVWPCCCWPYVVRLCQHFQSRYFLDFFLRFWPTRSSSHSPNSCRPNKFLFRNVKNIEIILYFVLFQQYCI